jgi:protein involved in polysaccharide export with SLBB domain
MKRHVHMILKRLPWWVLMVSVLTTVSAAAQSDTIIDTSGGTSTYGFDRPIDPDRYYIRPGERLEVYFIGTRLPKLFLQVNPEGQVVDQNIGVITVADLTLSEARSTLKEALKQAYDVENIAVSISGTMRSVFPVTGQVSSPGRYQAALSQHVSELIDSAGGITAQGSSRRIQFITPRDTQQVDLDRAWYLGDARADPRLYGGWKITVPAKSPPTIQVVGAVNFPRQIELLGDESIKEVIALAGGWSSNADTDNVRLLNDPSRSLRNGELRDGDIVYVPVGGGVGKNIQVFGAVQRPGVFSYTDGMRLSQLISNAGGPRPEANLSRVAVFRLPEVDAWGHRFLGRYAIMVNPGQTAMAETIHLRPGDSVFVPVELGYVSVSGDVRYPGRIMFSDEKPLSYYVKSAGGAVSGRAYAISLFDRITRTTREVSPSVVARDGDEIIVRLQESQQ